MIQLINLEVEVFLKQVEEASYKGYKRAQEENPTELLTKRTAMKKLRVGYKGLQGMIEREEIVAIGKSITLESVKKYLNGESCKK